MVTISQGKSDSHVEEFRDQSQMARNPLETREVLREDARKTKTSRSEREAVLVFLDYKLNAVWRLLWEKVYNTALRKVQDN